MSAKQYLRGQMTYGQGLAKLFPDPAACFIDVATNKNVGDDDKRLQASLLAARWLAWTQAGCNVFNLTESLTASLLLTENPALIQDIPLPYSCFCLIVPTGYIPHGHDHVGSAVNVVWVNRFTARGLDPRTDALFPKVPVELDSVGEVFISVGSTLDGDESVESNVPYLLAEKSRVDYGEEWQEFNRGLTLAMNFCSWLATLTPQQRSACRVGRPPGAAKDAPTTWMVGREVKLHRELREAAKLGLSRDAWKLRSRFTVRGHFRNQVCGVGRAERRLTWIEPYWKGPEGAEAWAHVYAASE